ncbi:MAG: methenyltetrahydromethanopterin cyclohydrolase, partial [Acetomicrobium sp.]
GIHKMFELGYDVLKVQHGFGDCPIPPLPNDPMIAMGRTNDAVLYGSRVWYTLRDEKSEIDAFIEKLPSDSSRDYGSPFLDLFRKYNFDFYQVDPLLFSPACVTINNVINGNYRSVGKKNIDLLKREWF